jgi:hypothetical protein
LATLQVDPKRIEPTVLEVAERPVAGLIAEISGASTSFTGALHPRAAAINHLLTLA